VTGLFFLLPHCVGALTWSITYGQKW